MNNFHSSHDKKRLKLISKDQAGKLIRKMTKLQKWESESDKSSRKLSLKVNFSFQCINSLSHIFLPPSSSLTRLQFNQIMIVWEKRTKKLGEIPKKIFSLRDAFPFLPVPWYTQWQWKQLTSSVTFRFLLATKTVLLWKFLDAKGNFHLSLVPPLSRNASRQYVCISLSIEHYQNTFTLM